MSVSSRSFGRGAVCALLLMMVTLERDTAASPSFTGKQPHCKGKQTLEPADARGIRKEPGSAPFLLGFLAAKKDTLEDRTAIEFDLSDIAGKIRSARLVIGVDDLDPGGVEGIINVFTYVGDGVVMPDDFFAGGPFRAVTFNQDSGTVSIDVTTAVQSASIAGIEFLGFVLSAGSSDRFFFGSIVNLPGPVLVICAKDDRDDCER